MNELNTSNEKINFFDYNWYVINTIVKKEDFVKYMIENYVSTEFENNIFSTKIPKKIYCEHIKGYKEQKTTILFPGYLFLLFEKNTNPETEEKIIHAIDELRFKNCGLIKIISDPITLKPLPLTKKDLMLLDKLLNSNDLVDYTIGLHIGDQIRIISGPFVGMESKIIKFNKRKYRLKVKLDFLGVNEIDLPYTYIEPINQ